MGKYDVCDCGYCKAKKKEEQTLTVIKAIAGFIVTTVAIELAIMAAPVALAAVGFGKPPYVKSQQETLKTT